MSDINVFDLNQVLNKYNLIPNGIIHIGAHLGEEKNLYNTYKTNEKTIWIEANPELIKQLKKNVDNDIVINEALSNEIKECTFNITSSITDLNNTQSSSLKDLDYHLIAHPNVYVSKKIIIKTNTMKNVIIEQNINMNNYDFLNIDTQGSELDILQGFEEYLYNIKYIYAEINVKELYKNIALLPVLDDFLYKNGFERVETIIHNDVGWGQGFYIRK